MNKLIARMHRRLDRIEESERRQKSKMTDVEPDMPLPVPVFVAPHRMAWLRRPELDTVPGVQMWELPTGALHAHDINNGPLLLQVIKWPKIKL